MPSDVFVIGSLRVKPFLIQCTGTAHKRVNDWKREKMLYEDVKFTENVQPTKFDFPNSLSNFTTQLQFQC